MCVLYNIKKATCTLSGDQCIFSSWLILPPKGLTQSALRWPSALCHVLWGLGLAGDECPLLWTSCPTALNLNGNLVALSWATWSPSSGPLHVQFPPTPQVQSPAGKRSLAPVQVRSPCAVHNSIYLHCSFTLTWVTLKPNCTISPKDRGPDCPQSSLPHPPLYHPAQRLASFVCKDLTVRVLGFVDHVVSVAVHSAVLVAPKCLQTA
jgi:hypothetical protein